jgi:hypothetical protein
MCVGHTNNAGTKYAIDGHGVLDGSAIRSASSNAPTTALDIGLDIDALVGILQAIDWTIHVWELAFHITANTSGTTGCSDRVGGRGCGEH